MTLPPEQSEALLAKVPSAAQGYTEAEHMLRDLIGLRLISDTAIRVARDHMLQFARSYARSLALQPGGEK